MNDKLKPRIPALRSSRRVLLALLVGASVGLSAPALAQKADEIVFGFLDDMSGVAAETGVDGLHAVQMAIEEANAKGGINGRKIRLISYDGKQDPQLTATFATRFAEDDNGLILIGGNPAVPVAAAIPVINELKVPYFTLSAATDAFTNPSTPYHFRFGPANGQDAQAVAGFIAEKGFKKAAIINNSLPYGLDGGGAVERALKARGVEVVAHEVYDTNATDLSPQVVKIRDAKPEVVIIWPYPADGGRVLRTLHQLNVDAVRVVARIALYATLRKMAGETADGALVTNTVDTERPEVQAFFKAYNQKYGEHPPTMYIAMAYDAAKVAIEVAGAPEVQAALAKKDIEGARNAVRLATERIGRFVGVQGGKGAAYQFSATRHQGPPDQNWFVWMEVRNMELFKADTSKVGPKR
ncbi:MAG: ABC transporter substrate-binding protein [Xanthobacteraceae bacterium]|nr:ABC transporter substrate-binding protein [Xanthobacteraceae bacterium]